MSEPNPSLHLEPSDEQTSKDVMFPGIIEELGFDNLKSSENQNSSIDTMEVEGIVFEFDDNMYLSNRFSSENSSAESIRVFNRLMIETAFIQRGIKVTGVDDHFTRDRDGRKIESTGSAALYVYPGLKTEADNFMYLINKTLGGKRSTSLSNYFFPPVTEILDTRDINLAFDKALELPEFAKLKEVAEAHRERVLAKAKAQRRGAVAL